MSEPTLAIIDATGHDEVVPANTTVAGLDLVQRTLRLAEVTGCDRAVVAAGSDHGLEVQRAASLFWSDDQFEIPVDVVAVDGDESVLTGDSVDRQVRQHLGADGARVLVLETTAAYQRNLVDRFVGECRNRSGICRLDGDRDEHPTLIAADSRGWEALAQQGEGALNRRSDAPIHSVDPADDWTVTIDEPADAEAAAENIWADCYKEIDGPISRHLNRPMSLAISRRIAHLDVTPNQISAVTFAVALVSAGFAAMGGVWWFAAAAALYQLTSILDGVDGELARGKYEFSVAGEWADSLGDNFKDILFYLGIGYGAMTTMETGIAGSGPEVWFWLGSIAATGKFLSLVGYSIWLIPRGRGCPLLFDWSFEEEDGEPADDGLVATLLANAKVLTKNDVIIFFGFALGMVGLLPWFLPVVAVGHPIVAFNIARELLSDRRQIVPEPTKSESR